MELETRQTCYYEHCKKLVFTSFGITTQAIYILFKLNHDKHDHHHDDHHHDDNDNDNHTHYEWEWPVVFIPSYITFGTLMAYGLCWNVKKCVTKKTEETTTLNDGLVRVNTSLATSDV